MKAGRISIDLSAGTAQFIVDMDKANAKLREFGQAANNVGSSGKRAFQQISDGGHKTVTDVQAASGALRLLEGGWMNNIRAGERWLSTFKGISGVLHDIYPVVGFIAISGAASRILDKVAELKKATEDAANAPQKIADGFGAILRPIETSNDEMRVMNDRLEMSIAKLKGKPENGLKAAIDEAKVAAESLGREIENDFNQIEKLAKESEVKASEFDWLGKLGNQLDRASTSDITVRIAEFRRELEKLRATSAAELNNTPGQFGIHLKVDPDQAAQQAGQRYKDALLKQREELTRDLRQTQRGLPGLDLTGGANPLPANTQERQALLSQELRVINAELDRVDVRVQNAKDKGQLAQAQATEEAAKPLKVWLNALSEAQAELEKARLASNVTGDDFHNILAKAAGEAAQKIDDLNQRLKEMKAPHGITDQQRAQFTAIIGETEGLNALAKAREEANKQSDEFEKKSREIQTSQDQHDAKDFGDIQKLRDDAFFYQQMAAAQEKGAEAVRKLQEARQVQDVRDKQGEGAALFTGKLLDAEEANRIAQTVAQLDRESEAEDRLTAAKLKGLDAERQAQAANIRNSGQSPDIIDAQLRKLNADIRAQDEASGRNWTAVEGYEKFLSTMRDGSVSTGKMVDETLTETFDGLNKQLSALAAGQKANWAGLFQSISGDLMRLSLRNIEGTIAGKLFPGAEKAASGTQQQNRQPWDQQIHLEGLNRPAQQQGIGSRDGQTTGTALFVTTVDASSAANPAPSISADSPAESKSGEGSKTLDRLVSGASSLFKIFGGFRADGGSVDSGMAHVVGEEGPELFVPDSDGTIIPNDYWKQLSQLQTGNQQIAGLSLPNQAPSFLSVLAGAGEAGLMAGVTKGISSGSTPNNLGFIPNNQLAQFVAPGIKPGFFHTRTGQQLAATGVSMGLGIISMLMSQRTKDHHFKPGAAYSIPDFNGSFAAGGKVKAGKTHLVGEKGEELFVSSALSMGNGANLIGSALSGPFGLGSAFHGILGSALTGPLGPVFSKASFGDFGSAFTKGFGPLGNTMDGGSPLSGSLLTGAGLTAATSYQLPSASSFSASNYLPSAPNLGSIGSSVGSSFGSIGTSLSSPFGGFSFGGFKASGGPVDPGYAYVVGERGPEVWTPPASGGSIIPNGAFGGGNVTVYNDNRGADPVLAERRMLQGMQAAVGTSTKISMQSYVQMQKRTPEHLRNKS